MVAKRILVCCALMVGAFASAENLSMGAKGVGTVKGDDGRSGFFGFQAVKFASDTESKFEGSLGFVQPPEKTRPGLALFMPMPTRLEVTGVVCFFSGPGVLRRKNAKGEEEELRGTIQCRVVDNRRAEAVAGTPDRMLVRFIRNGVQVYAFSGNVSKGDVEAFTRSIVQ